MSQITEIYTRSGVLETPNSEQNTQCDVGFIPFTPEAWNAYNRGSVDDFTISRIKLDVPVTSKVELLFSQAPYRTWSVAAFGPTNGVFARLYAGEKADEQGNHTIDVGANATSYNSYRNEIVSLASCLVGPAEIFLTTQSHQLRVHLVTMLSGPQLGMTAEVRSTIQSIKDEIINALPLPATRKNAERILTGAGILFARTLRI